MQNWRQTFTSQNPCPRVFIKLNVYSKRLSNIPAQAETDTAEIQNPSAFRPKTANFIPQIIFFIAKKRSNRRPNWSFLVAECVICLSAVFRCPLSDGSPRIIRDHGARIVGESAFGNSGRRLRDQSPHTGMEPRVSHRPTTAFTGLQLVGLIVSFFLSEYLSLYCAPFLVLCFFISYVNLNYVLTLISIFVYAKLSVW